MGHQKDPCRSSQLKAAGLGRDEAAVRSLGDCLEDHGEPVAVKPLSDTRFRKFTLTVVWSRRNSFSETILDKKEKKRLPWLPKQPWGQECSGHGPR